MGGFLPLARHALHPGHHACRLQLRQDHRQVLQIAHFNVDHDVAHVRGFVHERHVVDIGAGLADQIGDCAQSAGLVDCGHE